MTGLENPERSSRRGDEHTAEHDLDEFVGGFDAWRAGIVPDGLLSRAGFDPRRSVHPPSMPAKVCDCGVVSDNQRTDETPDVMFAEAGLALGEAILDALGPWAEWQAVRLGGVGLAADGRRAGEAIAAVAAPRLATLLAADVDEQRGTPLTIVREAHLPLTEMLLSRGIAPVQRDPADIAAQPDDVFALTPRAFSDLGPEVHDAGLRWGVTKAFAHRARHRR